MGKTIKSITQVFNDEQAAFTRFRRALRHSDQLVLDDLFASARQHLAAAAYASHALPMEIFLLSMLLEEHKEVTRLKALTLKENNEVLRLTALMEKALPGLLPPAAPDPDAAGEEQGRN